MSLIRIENSLTKAEGIQQTYIAAPVSQGGTASPVKNIDGFNGGWASQIGQTGEETAEIMLVSAASGTTLSFGTSPSHSAGTLLFSHNLDTPIYQIRYDRIIINRSTSGTAGPFSALATVSIQPDSQFTQYSDDSGAASYAYYVQYYNSVTADTSGSSSVFLPGGPTFYSLQKIRQRIRDKLYSSGYVRTDDIIDDWVNEWYELMQNAAVKVNQGYMVGTAAFSFGTAGLGTVTSSDFKQPLKLEVSYDSGVTFTPSHEVAIREYSSLDFFSPNNPQHAWLGEQVFQVLPASNGGSVKLTYSQRFTPLVNDADELTQTLKAYTTCAVEYCLSVAYGLDQKDTQQQEHFQKFVALQNAFISEVQPRDLTGAKNIELVESLSGMNDDVSMSTEMIF